MFKLEQISYRLANHRTLLQPIDLTFHIGKVYGLIGHNGSGKSTLIKLLANQQPCSSGKLWLQEREISRWGTREFAREVAYLPQHLPAATNLTARELIQMGRYAWNGLFGRDKQKDHAAVENALRLTHTETFADQLVDTLSGGERSRIWLAMLLAQQSRFLLLDEPLAALDIAHQVEVMQLIQQLSRQLNIGVVVVIHDVNLAARFCDHLIALHSGKLLMQGSPQQLMTQANLAAVYGIELNVLPHPTEAVPVAFF
ncbi:iron complex transport system ATP-binding protein [Pasteurella testudinis DSM 23072]|uniref:Iron complex transport system ATP-binding protein n=1 Tax=Pasteurella testudinis DSM 23072 TaxID=1122938 RepID=A0A1W1UJK7_9PAST|nr:ATP-binding cassette domain-containing protein [Pasteurella testudinis]SMB81257.1 iron complex transport system ATP-binding protein [Pasteurella testudinis DSM 23072]SUB51956.1 Fe(3+) dicitrate transport ATP-binding protein FecE [Pasteurella testudinis]